jgi:hypothetical protein
MTALPTPSSFTGEEAERLALQKLATQKLAKFKSRASLLSKAEVAALAMADDGSPSGAIDPSGKYDTP